jgi:hypothetical protein
MNLGTQAIEEEFQFWLPLPCANPMPSHRSWAGRRLQFRLVPITPYTVTGRS